MNKESKNKTKHAAGEAFESSSLSVSRIMKMQSTSLPSYHDLVKENSCISMMEYQQQQQQQQQSQQQHTTKHEAL
jgi:hypothetical protein